MKKLTYFAVACSAGALLLASAIAFAESSNASSHRNTLAENSSVEVHSVSHDNNNEDQNTVTASSQEQKDNTSEDQLSSQERQQKEKELQKQESETQQKQAELQKQNSEDQQQKQEELQKKESERNNAFEERAQEAAAHIKDAQKKAEEEKAQHHTDLEDRISHITDSAKRTLATRIADQFDHINTVWTDHFTLVLNRYDAILQKIQTRADMAAANGNDVSAVTTLIQKTTTDLATARTAVEAQATKSYTAKLASSTSNIEVSSSTESHFVQNFRDSFNTLHESLLHDLFALRDGAVRTVRTDLQRANQALQTIPGVDNDVQESSSTASSTH
ncbi:MAG: hypothetical protein KGI50_03150 [Patescibacteria group bacterium]|nr:hypothetical protein [Patescibacteria group bacterium]MDE2438288.1 hypothetical protein [Patescibacteria group bacterium]